MQAKAKSAAIIVATLLIGMLLGALAYGQFLQHRFRAIPRPGHFAAFTEKFIEPRDAAQRREIRRVLRGAAPRLRELDRRHRQSMQALMDSVHAELGTLLTPEQRERMEERKKWFREVMGPRRFDRVKRRWHRDHD